MLTTLKDIFRPTRRKVMFAAVLGHILTIVALFLSGLARHGPHFVDYATLPFKMPYAFLVWLNLRGHFALIVFPVFTFLYWYIIFSLCLHVVRRGRS